MSVIRTCCMIRGGAGGWSKLSSSTVSRPKDSADILSNSARDPSRRPADSVAARQRVGERVAGIEAGQDEDRPLNPLGGNSLDNLLNLGYPGPLPGQRPEPPPGTAQAGHPRRGPATRMPLPQAGTGR